MYVIVDEKKKQYYITENTPERYGQLKGEIKPFGSLCLDIINDKTIKDIFGYDKKSYREYIEKDRTKKIGTLIERGTIPRSKPILLKQKNENVLFQYFKVNSLIDLFFYDLCKITQFNIFIRTCPICKKLFVDKSSKAVYCKVCRKTEKKQIGKRLRDQKPNSVKLKKTLKQRFEKRGRDAYYNFYLLFENDLDNMATVLWNFYDKEYIKLYRQKVKTKSNPNGTVEKEKWDYIINWFMEKHKETYKNDEIVNGFIKGDHVLHTLLDTIRDKINE